VQVFGAEDPLAAYKQLREDVAGTGQLSGLAGPMSEAVAISLPISWARL
jgi:hypothetical protein